MLAVIGTHPIQYHAPVYRVLQTQFGVPVTAVYGSDFSIAGYRDREFGAEFAWDTDLLSGYQQVFLSRVAEGGARNFDEVATRGLGNALRKIAPRAVLVLGYSPRFNQMAFYQAWRTNRPILFRAEAADHHQSRSPFKAFARDRVLRWYYQRLARILYIGKRSYEHYKRLNCPDEKLVFSPYCVDISPFEVDEQARARLRTAMRESLGVSDQQIILLFSGKLSPRKGPELILQAVKQLSSELRNRILAVFLGSGQLEEELRRLAQESPRVAVFFPGFQNQTQLSRYYHSADLLILPSREGETWGLVVNEALHHGLPCVASDAVGCGPDLIENGMTGYTFQSSSSDSLAAMLRSAVELIGRDDVRLNCRQKVSGYGVEEAARGIAKAYSQVTGLRQ
jgi:glycosyltransferase involved in cell wall biosynthesis